MAGAWYLTKCRREIVQLGKGAMAVGPRSMVPYGCAKSFGSVRPRRKHCQDRPARSTGTVDRPDSHLAAGLLTQAVSGSPWYGSGRQELRLSGGDMLGAAGSQSFVHWACELDT